MKKIGLAVAGFFLVWVVSCERFEPAAVADNATLDGPVDGLTPEQTRRFVAGDVAFNDEVFTPETGLGPIFVATSCGSCHAGDGKGHPFTTLTRFGQPDEFGNQFLDRGGPQLQHRAVPGYEPEQIPAGATFAKLLPPQNTGLGFLELVSDADLLALAEANQNHPDGVRGRPNWMTLPHFITPRTGAAERNGQYIGRFGKKAGVYSLLQQTVGAYNQDIGIASVYDPTDVYSYQLIDPEVTTQTVDDVVFYLQTLKAPMRRNPNKVVRGNDVFVTTGCEACHKQTLVTGASPVAALAYQTIHPYTDLLVHDMGPGLDDGYTEGTARTAEWRTPPLWGLGLSKRSQGGAYFLLHDGRACSLDEAIRLHGGEATTARDRYVELSETDRNALIDFLESL